MMRRSSGRGFERTFSVDGALHGGTRPHAASLRGTYPRGLRQMAKDTKTKSVAVLATSDGAGGMTQIVDRRFETGDWPISFEVPMPDADTWLQYLQAECTKRGWNSGSMGQLGAKENSGSI